MKNIEEFIAKREEAARNRNPKLESLSLGQYAWVKAAILGAIQEEKERVSQILRRELSGIDSIIERIENL